MEDEILISVLMTSYNREKYIGDAIKSVLDSDYTKFELIIVDDCSTDNTVAIAESYQRLDSRVQVHVNEKNLGQFDNRNKAASYAKGMYLKYVDSDDLIYPYTLRFMLQMMLAFPDAGLGFCHTCGDSPQPFPFTLKSAESYQKHYFKGGLLYVGPIGLIIKRKAFMIVGGFENYGMPSDNHLSLKIAAQYPVVAVPRDLFFWRLHGEQAFNESSSVKNVFDNYAFNNNLLRSTYCPLKEKDQFKALQNNARTLVRNITKRILKKPADTVKVFSLLRSRRISLSGIIKNSAVKPSFH